MYIEVIYINGEFCGIGKVFSSKDKANDYIREFLFDSSLSKQSYQPLQIKYRKGFDLYVRMFYEREIQ